MKPSQVKRMRVLLVLLALVSIFPLMQSGCGGGGDGGSVGGGGSVVTPTATPTATPTPGPAWLDYLNQFRDLALLARVTENAVYDDGCSKHATYMVKNNLVAHTEDPALPYYTAAGALAGENSDVMGTTNIDETDEMAIDLWIAGPFHAVSILNPHLQQAGYGAFREAHPGAIQMAAALDVGQGTSALPSAHYPIEFPSNGSTAMPLLSYTGGESPDPIGTYGYSAPSGPAIMIQLGPGTVTPAVTAHSFSQGGAPLEHICYDETNYVTGDAAQQTLGRDILHGASVVVIMPRDPLMVGTTYTASITSGVTTYTWTFTTSTTAHSIRSKGKVIFN